MVFTVFCCGFSALFLLFIFRTKLLTHIAYTFILELYNMCLYPRFVQQFTLGLVFDYLLGTFIVHVHVGFSYHTHTYTKNKPT